MPEGWRSSNWGDEVSLQYGKAIRGYQNAIGPYRVFGSNGPVGWHTDALASGPGVILGRKGAYRGVRYSRDPFFVIDTAYYVQPRSEMDMRWLYYAVIHHRLGEIDDGSPIPSTTRAAVYVRDLEVPSLDEQRAIAEVLGSLDDKIDLNRRMNETLEAMAQAVFRDWFVDFGPTRRKIDGASDPITIMGGLVTDPDRAQELADLFPAAFAHDGLPQGWEEKPIGTLAEVVGGSTPSTKTDDFWKEGHHLWATPKDLSKLEGLFLFDTERRITDAGLAKISSGLSPAGTVLLSSRAPIGYLAVADSPTAVNQGFIGIRPSRLLSTAMALLWCRENMERIKASANGSTFQEISKRNFRPLSVTIASNEVVDAFDTIIVPILELMRTRSRESRTLIATRNLFLPKLMSGEIRLREAEEFAEAAQ